MRLSRIDYGKSDRLDGAWLVLHYEDSGPCGDGGDSGCGLETYVQVKVPGLAYSWERRRRR